MAKATELTKLKKGKAEFTLIGKTKIGDFTFKLDEESQKEDSDWVYNQMNLQVDCGEECGVISCDLMGGYGTARENLVFVHGKKTEENGNLNDDFKNRYEINWDDRFDEEILETIGDMCFITVALDKEKNKTEKKRFLSAYDAIEYIASVLEEDMVIRAKGNLTYNFYKEQVQVKKEITSITLSKAEEKDFKATFTQSVLLAKDAIGKLDKDSLSIPITCMIVEYFKLYNDKEVKTMLPMFKVFDMKIDASDTEKAKKILKVFNVKNVKKVTQLTVDGLFTKGEMSTTGISEKDIPAEVLELIELGMMDKDDVLGKMAFANGAGGKNEKMFIKTPHIKFVGEAVKVPAIDKIPDIYTVEEVELALILESLGVKDDLEEALEEELVEEEAEDENWLDELE